MVPSVIPFQPTSIAGPKPSINSQQQNGGSGSKAPPPNPKPDPKASTQISRYRSQRVYLKSQVQIQKRPPQIPWDFQVHIPTRLLQIPGTNPMGFVPLVWGGRFGIWGGSFGICTWDLGLDALHLGFGFGVLGCVPGIWG